MHRYALWTRELNWIARTCGYRPSGHSASKHPGQTARYVCDQVCLGLVEREIAATGCSVLSVGGASDNRMLYGTAKGYGSSHPCFPIVAITRANNANPIIVIDEVDKVSSSSHNGNIWSTLLGMLEFETSKTYFDEGLMLECDISQISWILTANDISSIPEPLLSRVEVIKINPPRPEDFDALYTGIMSDIAEELMIHKEYLPELDQKAVHLLRSHFKSGKIPNVRKLKAAIYAAIGAVAEMPSNRIVH